MSARRTKPWRCALDVAVVALAGSGAAWLVAHYVFAERTDFGSVNPPWATVVLALHGAAAMLSLVVLGAWLATHVQARLPQPRKRWTGVLQLAAWLWLLATGYALYYLADEMTRPTWSTLHWVVGLGLVTVMLLHRGVESDDGTRDKT